MDNKKNKKGTEFKKLVSMRVNRYSIIAMICCIIINIVGQIIFRKLNFPIWLDTIGTMVIAIQFGPIAGAIVGTLSVVIIGIVNDAVLSYAIVGVAVGVIIGFYFAGNKKREYLGIISTGIITGIVAALICVPLDIINYDGKIGNIWGNAFYEMISTTVNSSVANCFGAELFMNVPDKVLTLLISLSIIKLVQKMVPDNKSHKKILSISLILALITGLFPFSAVKVEAADFESDYETVTFGSEDGLLAVQANAVAQTHDGYMWVGTYSGLYQYDGIRFRETEIDSRISNVMSLFVDSRGRLWIGTNDTGVFCYDPETGETICYNSDNGLTADSIRCINEDTAGNIYIGTVRYVTKVTPSGELKTFSEWENVFYAISFESLEDGGMVGVTNSGCLFLMKNDILLNLTEYTSEEGVYYREVICSDNKLYVGTSGNVIQEMEIVGEDFKLGSQINLINLSYLNKMVYYPEYNGMLICCENGMGFVDLGTGKLSDMTKDEFEGAVSDVCVDDQGDIWFVSNKYGILKYSRSPFRNILNKAKMNTGIVNALMLSDGHLYIGTDTGLKILDINDFKNVSESYVSNLKETRIRNIFKDSKGNLWFSTYGENGLIRVDKEQRVTYYNDNRGGLLGGRCRSVIELSDGRILVASNLGLSFIDGDEVVATIGAENGLNNQYILTMYEREDGSILAGSDGDGIYIIKNDRVSGHIGKTEGLKTAVVLRIVKCTGGYLYVTSNAIYYDDGREIKMLDKFPYSNNYDILISEDGNCWITSSAGLFVVKEDQLLKNEEYSYTLLNDSWGLRTSFTANSWNVLDGDQMYLCCVDGVRVISTTDYKNIVSDYQVHLKSITADDELCSKKDGKFVIPPNKGRIEFNVAVNNYSLSNPMVHYYLEGAGDEGITCYQNEIVPLAYTNLTYGDYKFHIDILDSATGEVEKQIVYDIEKQAMMYERLYFRLYLLFLCSLLMMYIVWLFYAINKKTQSVIGLQKEIVTDPMTGIYNKAGSHKVLTKLCAEEKGILLMIDLDSFKLVNDIYGHDMGDRILIRFAELIQQALGEDNMAGRIGGDEFIGFIKNTDDEEDVSKVTKFLNREIVKSAKEYMGDDMNIPLGTSIGAVRCPVEGTDFEDLFKLADKALYVVKQHGKHNYSMYQKKSADAEQSKDKKDKNNLEQIKKIIGERNEGKGAYSISFDKLQTVYKYINRYDRANASNTGFIRFSVHKNGGGEVTEDVLDRFEDHLTVRLKKNDVICRYSGDMFVLCVGCDRDSCKGIAGRMIDSWKSLEENSDYKVTFEIETVGSEQKAAEV
jgi:diguanylate cyclase (GGDEF) domain